MNNINIYEVLTSEELDALKEQNSKNHYGFSRSGLRKFITEHKKAREENDIKTMAKIEYRLTDCNFHGFCGKLSNGNYIAAKGEVDSW